jgi:hypothetical protein
VLHFSHDPIPQIRRNRVQNVQHHLTFSSHPHLNKSLNPHIISFSGGYDVSSRVSDRCNKNSCCDVSFIVFTIQQTELNYSPILKVPIKPPTNALPPVGQRKRCNSVQVHALLLIVFSVFVLILFIHPCNGKTDQQHHQRKMDLLALSLNVTDSRELSAEQKEFA